MNTYAGRRFATLADDISESAIGTLTVSFGQAIPIRLQHASCRPRLDDGSGDPSEFERVETKADSPALTEGVV